MTNENLILAKKYYYLARLFSMGTKNINADTDAAVEYFEKSAALGYPPALFQMGMNYCHDWRSDEPDYEKAFEYFMLSNTDDGEYWIGRCYHYGYGVRQSYPKAIAIYERLAGRGYSQAMMALGHLYRGGVGVEKDQEKAATYYLMAAEAGNGAGCLHIGISYKHGFGVEKNEELADKWLKEWAKRRPADNAEYYFEKEPDEYAKAMDFFKLLADRGDGDAIRVLRAESKL